MPASLRHVVGGVDDEACPVGQVGVSWGLATLLLEFEGGLSHLSQRHSHGLRRTLEMMEEEAHFRAKEINQEPRELEFYIA